MYAYVFRSVVGDSASGGGIEFQSSLVSGFVLDGGEVSMARHRRNIFDKCNNYRLLPAPQPRQTMNSAMPDSSITGIRTYDPLSPE